MANMQILVNQKSGPLPIKGHFTPSDDAVPSFFLTGTAYSNRASMYCTIELRVYDDKGTEVASTTATVFSNEANQHKTLEAIFRNQPQLQFGMTYSFVIDSVNQGVVIGDQNDTYSAIIFY